MRNARSHLMFNSLSNFSASKCWTRSWFLTKTVTISGQDRHTQRNLFSTSSNETQFNKNRTFSHPKKVRFYPSLRARPHIVLFHARKKYDFTSRSVRDLICVLFHTRKKYDFDPGSVRGLIVLFHTRKKYDFTCRSVRDLISYFFTLEKSTILPVAPCV